MEHLMKRLLLIRGQSFLLKVADSLGRYLLKFVSPRFPYKYRNFVIGGGTTT